MLLYNKAKIFALSLSIPVEDDKQRNTRFRRQLQPTQNLEEYYIMSTIVQCESMKHKKVKNIKTKVFLLLYDKQEL